MMIFKFTTYCRLLLVEEMFDTKLYAPTNQNSIKVPQVVKLTDKKTLLKDIRD